MGLWIADKTSHQYILQLEQHRELNLCIAWDVANHEMIQDLVWPVQFRIIECHIVATFLIRLTWIWHKLSLINITAVHVCCCSAAVWCCICFHMVRFMCVVIWPILMQPGGSPCNPVNHFAIMYNFCNQHVIELNCYDCGRIMVSALVLKNTKCNFCAIKAICLKRLRITSIPQSSHNRPDCKYRGLDCGRIATTQKSLFWGLRGTERIAKDPQACI